MKTFLEYFEDVVQSKLLAGEINEGKAQEWFVEVKTELQKYAAKNPMAPIVQMPPKKEGN